MNTLLSEEYNVLKKWVIVMDKRQDKNAASTPATTIEPSAQNRYCGKGSGGGIKKRRENGKEQRQVQ